MRYNRKYKKDVATTYKQLTIKQLTTQIEQLKKANALLANECLNKAERIDQLEYQLKLFGRTLHDIVNK